uniref:Uncharacterized protein n=1 Tax=Tetranychus urticae TaxID=32264 RepID=T1K919_TETUR
MDLQVLCVGGLEVTLFAYPLLLGISNENQKLISPLESLCLCYYTLIQLFCLFFCFLLTCAQPLIHCLPTNLCLLHLQTGNQD